MHNIPVIVADRGTMRTRCDERTKPRQSGLYESGVLVVDFVVDSRISSQPES